MKQKIFIRAAITLIALFTFYGTIANAAVNNNRYYKATLILPNPSTISAGSTVGFKIRIYACDASTSTTDCGSNGTFNTSQQLASASITVPTGFTSVTSSPTVTASNASKSWTASLSAGLIRLTANQGTDKLALGEWIDVIFSANAPCTYTNPNTWITHAYNDVWTDPTANPADFTAWLRSGSDPEVTIEGTCSEFTGWNTGDYCTVGQGGWGADPKGHNPASNLDDNFSSIYPSPNYLKVGVSHWIQLTSQLKVNDYLPAGETPDVLDMDYTNPASTSSGVFGGQVVSLKINVDFNAAQLLGNTNTNYGSLVLTGTGKSLDGQNIQTILNDAEIALGGGALPSGYNISDLNTLIDALNNAFSKNDPIIGTDCAPTDWANDHLVPANP